MKNESIKSLLIGLFLATGGMAAFGQGQLNFFTYNVTNSAYGEVFLSDGVTPANSNFVGQVWYSDVSSTASLSAIGPVMNFSAAVPGYIAYGSILFPSDAPGTTVWLQLRVWNASAGSDWATAMASPNLTEFGTSEIESHILGGVPPFPNPPIPVPQFNDFENFSLIPEPATMALAGLGIVSLWIFRRRN